MKKCRTLSLALVLCLCAGCAQTAQGSPEAVATSAATGLKDGEYTAVTQGKNGDVNIKVTIADGKISVVEVTDHKETTGLFEEPFEQLPKEIVENQTVNVDVISGSTFSSNALIDGVKDCITQAGGNVEDYMGTVEKEVSTEVEDLTTQVVVIGAGASGLCTAVQAQENGLDVIVVEKNSSTAQSSSNLAAGYMAIGSREQEELGITPDMFEEDVQNWDDMSQKIFEYWTNQMSWRVNQKLIHDYIYKTGETTDWLMDHGFEFITVKNMQGGDGWYHNNTDNYHLMGKGKYSVYADPMFAGFVDDGGQLYFNTTATSLITDENGNVTGVTCTQKDGKTLNIHADAVVLCTGGFGSDTDYVFNTIGFQGVLEGAGNAGTGDGMRMAWAAGAMPYKEDALLVHHMFTTAPYTDLSDFGNKMNCILNYVPSFLNLNPVGTRYRSESAVRCGVEASETTYTQGYGWNIFTQDMVDTLVQEGVGGLGLSEGMAWVPLSFGYHPEADELWTELPEVLDRMEKEGVMVKADTLEELAEKTGMDYDVMSMNIEQYNGYCATGNDETYGKNSDWLIAVDNGPYYAMKTITRYITSLGGLKVDENLSVLDSDNKEIQGLYAAGLDACADLYGDAYVDIEGAGFAWAFVSGRMAADSITADLSK